jgi:hypothetical protein
MTAPDAIAKVCAYLPLTFRTDGTIRTGMKIADAAVIQWGLVSGHRAGAIEFKRLLKGQPRTPGNFELSLVRTGSDYYTPRHRHNFDQIRLGLNGSLSWAPGKDLTQGSVGYFPEGTPYGPQTDKAGAIFMLLQFGGASGNGFMSYDELSSGFWSMRELGKFAKGTFAYIDENGTAQRKDGYEAVWEHANGRKLEYPAPRYEEPIIAHPERFDWIGDANSRGVTHKWLGSFSERNIGFGFVRLDERATFQVPSAIAPRLFFIRAGAVRLDGRDNALGTQSAFMIDSLEANVTVSTASLSAELFVMQMPTFNDQANEVNR